MMGWGSMERGVTRRGAEESDLVTLQDDMGSGGGGRAQDGGGGVSAGMLGGVHPPHDCRLTQRYAL